MKASRRSSWTKPGRIGLLLMGLAAAPAGADNAAAPHIQIQGFAAQALVATRHNQFFGDSRDGISSEFTEAGLHGAWQVRDALRVSGQILYRRAGETDRDGLRLDYAHLDWRFHQDEARQIGARIGKVKIPYGLYNETRDVPFTRPGILLPQSVYFDNSRSLVLAAPGMFVYGGGLHDWGSTEWSVGAIRPDFDSSAVEYNFLGNDLPGKLDGRRAFGARFRWDSPTDTTFALTYANAQADYAPASLDPFSAGKIDFRNLMVSAQHRLGPLTLTAEYGRPKVWLKGFGSLLPDGLSPVETFYAQGEWRFAPAWELLLRHDVFYRSRKDRNGRNFAALTGLPAHGMYAHDTTLGLRWDATPSIVLRAEYHRVNGTGWLPGPDNPNLSAHARDWDMWLLQAAWRF
ncbi:MAG: hypothetical protein ACK4R8_05045 [Thiobacillus sp.]